MENNFKLKFLKCTEQNLADIGLDKTYINRAVDKHIFKTIKIYDLSCAQANIIKQTALSSGTDCAVHREVITGKVNSSDCILSGSIDELKKISEKLKYQPLKLSVLAQNLKDVLSDSIAQTSIRDIVVNWKETYLMGILNLTPDSFSDGGMYNSLDKALEHYKELLNDGADIIDIGGESTRPYSEKVSPQEEQNRVISVIEKIREFDKNTILSIDTRNASTARTALEKGVDIINDISGTEWDADMPKVAAEFACPIIIGHSSASPDIMQNNTNYKDVVEDIFNYFFKKIDLLTFLGVEKHNIILDPGLGFGKTTAQNFEIINRIDEFKSLGCPILIGHSRKNFIKETIQADDIDSLDKATAMLTQKLIEKKVNIVRVHNVKINNFAKKLGKSLF